MKDEECKMPGGKNQCGNKCGQGGGNAIYGLGVVGAMFYFLQNANSLGMVLVGIGKAIFWPAVLVYKVLTLLRI